ncbi:hypothetical protein [Niabella sp.]|uniref:hypothetical protein n=1 Tax=Niabella sp. TaxID=1962976 RepID=UPI002605534C|nr:hypothetical protein [Niabella sp.]
MLEQISWKEFLLVLGGATAAYYGILAVAGRLRVDRRTPEKARYVYSPLKERVAESSTSAEAPVNEPASAFEPVQAISGVMDKEEDQEFSLLEQLADELQVIISQFSTTTESKENLIEYLAKEIAQYPGLNKPAFKRAINTLVIRAAREECGLEITEEEVNQCWPLLPYVDQG